MGRLTGVRGTEFDRAFVDLIAHHHEAIDSAEQVITEGEHPQVRQLAQDIVAEQQAEIGR